MKLAVRFTPRGVAERREVLVHPTYTLAEVHHELDAAVEYGGRVQLLDPKGLVFELSPNDYDTLAVVDTELA